MRMFALLIALPLLLAACAVTPRDTRAGVSTGATIGGADARVGASTSGRGVYLGLGLGHLIR